MSQTSDITAADRPTPGRLAGAARRSMRPSGLRDYAILVSFVGLFIALAVGSDKFLTKTNLLNLVDQSAALGIIACAGTLVIIAGGFDLSTAAIFAIAGVVAGKVAIASDPALGQVVGILCGLAFGLANGLAINIFGINSFIATLASSLVIRGIALVITSGFLVTVTDTDFASLGSNEFVGVKYTTWIFIGFVVVLWFLLRRTAFGRYVYAVGGNHEAARLSGIRVNLIRTVTFAVSGLAAGVAGVMIASRNITGQADSGVGLELTAIAAIVVGGTSIAGGDGAIWRTVLGVLLLTMIGNGFNLLNIDPIYQNILYGGIILVAVAIDARARRRSR